MPVCCMMLVCAILYFLCVCESMSEEAFGSVCVCVYCMLECFCIVLYVFVNLCSCLGQSTPNFSKDVRIGLS